MSVEPIKRKLQAITSAIINRAEEQAGEDGVDVLGASFARMLDRVYGSTTLNIFDTRESWGTRSPKLGASFE
jgi:hypothetical protein